jgi:hypothetical protein
MRCPRCRGFMVVDHFTDMQSDGGPLWLRAWRCVNCGEVVEPGITVLRRAQHSRLPRLVTRLKKGSSHVPESVPLGV